MIGRWVGASRGQTYDYTFHPKHYFTLTIKSQVEPASKVFGYWDVRDRSLHMGMSASETDAAPIEVNDDAFTIIAPGGIRTDFLRQRAG